jgi:hypothetical protein
MRSRRRRGSAGAGFATPRLMPAFRRFPGVQKTDLEVRSGSRNYGDRDKGLAPLSLCESR